MTRREIIAAWNAQADDANGWHHLGEDEKLEWAMKLEREACAKVAERSWQEFRDTKDAHERLSPAPFKLEKFGFNPSKIQQSRIIADNIRARGQA
jgi:hypothetical protein